MVKDGIINISKPQNMTSRDVVNIVRRTLGIRKTGHTGTLDPMATGVLPVCLGRATRIAEYMGGVWVITPRNGRNARITSCSVT